MQEGTPPFAGFYVPNSTPVPDTLFDELLAELSGAELKIVLYIIRRTFGFKRQSDKISLNQLINGITTRDGRTLDRGTGLSRDSVTKAVRSLEEKGMIIKSKTMSVEKGCETNTYALKLRPPSENRTTPATHPQSENRTGGSPKIVPAPVRKSDTQDTGIQDTEKTVNVNGSLKRNAKAAEHAPAPDKTDLRKLPDLPQPKEQTQLIAEEILRALGDTHSQAFYYLVAAKIPASVIHKTLSEIKHDGARRPEKVFAYRMKP
jgi:phage replication O-like protein O